MAMGNAGFIPSTVGTVLWHTSQIMVMLPNVAILHPTVQILTIDLLGGQHNAGA